MVRISCQDIDDKDYWQARMEGADQEDAETLLDRMVGLCSSLTKKRIAHSVAERRYQEGVEIFKRRFSMEYIPFFNEVRNES